MAIVVIGAVFVDIKGFPQDLYLPTGRNAGSVEFVHGGVGRNVAEDIANVELRPTFVSLVDESAQGEEVLRKLRSHKVNTDYIRAVPNGMGMWLAVFDQTGDLAGSISQRPDLDRIRDILDEKGDEIISAADSVVVEADMGKRIVKKTLDLAEKYGKPVYGVVANMGIATERRDLLQRMDCFVCNQPLCGRLLQGKSRGALRRSAREAREREHPLHRRHHGQPRRCLRQPQRRGGLLPRRACQGARYHRRGRRLLRGRGHRPDLSQVHARGRGDRHKAGRVGHQGVGECVPALSPP